jgi:hypothetical protein
VFETGQAQCLECLRKWSLQGGMGTDLNEERGGGWARRAFLADAAAEALECFTESHLGDKIFDPVVGAEVGRLFLGSGGGEEAYSSRGDRAALD